MNLKCVFTLCLLVGITFGTEVNGNKTIHSTTTKATTTTKVTTTTTSTTEAPSTTTTAATTPSTTTSSTTTQPPSTPSTPPTTTSPPAPTSPPSSTPAPPPQKEWVVIDPKTNVTCILAKMEVTFNLQMGKDTESIKISPATAKAQGGHCGNSTQVLKIVWTQEYSIPSTLVVSFNHSKNNYFISGLNLSLAHNSSEGIIVASEFTGANLTLYETNVNTSYSCESVELPQMKNSKNETVDIKLHSLLIEAFRSQNTTSFSSSHYCSGEVPDIVPLVVGIALAALVLVVVIAYLIGRRRSQARGYLSM